MSLTYNMQLCFIKLTSLLHIRGKTQEREMSKSRTWEPANTSCDKWWFQLLPSWNKVNKHQHTSRHLTKAITIIECINPADGTKKQSKRNKFYYVNINK